MRKLTPELFETAMQSILEHYSEKHFLLAISGGVDSMVLATLFQQCHLNFDVAHINYHFRGEDSNLDQKVVEYFCKKNHIPLHLKEITEMEKMGMKSLQNWAREIRYDFFFKLLNDKHLDYIVTAHHLNDELETFIINLSRGSGIKGLCGIPNKENRILRPLLDINKNEIYEFAKANNVDYREDESNQKNDYLRNKIRNQVIPGLLELSPNFLEKFNESLHHLSTVDEYYQHEIEKNYKEVLISGGDKELVLNKKLLFSKPRPIIVEIIRKLGFVGLEIDKIIKADHGKFFRSSSYEIMIKKNEIFCKKSL